MKFEVRVFPDKAAAGAAGAETAAAIIRETLNRQATMAIVFASAVSQDAFLAALRAAPDLAWERITAFHMDEYAGMSPEHPASFRRFLRERLFDHVPVAAFHQLNGEAPDLAAECARYAALLEEASPQLAIMGIGENGHVAFIDPPVCDFREKRLARPVELDEVCRMQQVRDGAFARFEDVPKQAISLTTTLFRRIRRALVLVNGVHKAAAVQATIEGPITEACPASVLRWHSDATLFLDRDAASLLRY
jgi:glucosamine-6-phosphate deaminase